MIEAKVEVSKDLGKALQATEQNGTDGGRNLM